MGLNARTTGDLEGDADTEGSGSADTNDENSLFDSQHSASQEKEPLSMKRRIALVGALLLCVFTVFAFAFLLPCHRPRCQKVPICPGKGDLTSVNWTANFSGVVPGIISLVDMTGFGVPDILVEFEIEESEVKNSSFLKQICKGKNCHGGGVLAIDGACGVRLWVFSRNSSFGLLACEGIAGRTDVNVEHCLLLEEKVKLVLFNVSNGTTKWQSELPTRREISSFKYVSDVDGDGVRDIVFVNEEKSKTKKGNINMLSGKTGKVIGDSLPLPESHSGSNVLALHSLSSKEQFLIVGSVSVTENSTSLWAISMVDLLKKVKNPTEKIPGVPWGKQQPDTATGFISVLKDSLILVQPLLADLNSDGVKDVVFLIKENGISLLAMNGDDLSVMWKMIVPMAVSIHKLFQTQHSVNGNSTDVVLVVEHANQSSALLVMDGQTGKIVWSFHSKTGFPVAPIPLRGVMGMKQAFVVWLSKAEAMSLIPKPRKSRQIQEDSLKDMIMKGYARQSTRKLLSTASRFAGKRAPKYKHHRRSDMSLQSDLISHSDWLDQYKPSAQDGHFDDSKGDDDGSDDMFDDDSTDLGLEEFDFGPEQEIQVKSDSDSPFPVEQVFDAENENIAADSALMLTLRREDSAFVEKRGHKAPHSKNPIQKHPYVEEWISQQQKKSDEREDLATHNHDLEQELRDLTYQQKEEAPVNGQKKEVSVDSVKKDVPAVRIQKKSKTYLISTKQDDDSLMNGQKKDETSNSSQREDQDSVSNQKKEEDFFSVRQKTLTHVDTENVDSQMASKSEVLQDKQFLTEDTKQDNLNPELVKKPSYHKRSVGSQTGSQCVRSSDDNADSYVAVLLMKGADDRQQIVEITEERPLYLDAEEYESLFNVKKGDTRSSSCLRLVPSLKSEPELRHTEDGLDLVYTISFVSGDHSHHVGQVRKMTMAQVFERVKGLKGSVIAGKHQSKRESDYSFSFPRVLK